MNKAILITGINLQALYVSGELVYETVEIGATDLLKLAEQHQFCFSSFCEIWACGEDMDFEEENAAFPNKFSDLKEKYNVD